MDFYKARSTVDIHIIIYVFKKQFIYMIIIVRRKRAAKQASGGAARRGFATRASAGAVADEAASHEGWLAG